MENNVDLQDELEAIANNFDPIPFIDSIMETIKGMASENAPIPNTFFYSVLDVQSGESSESRLNTFLRILGFPATRGEASLSDKSIQIKTLREQIKENSQGDKSEGQISKIVEDERIKILSQDGTLNYFNAGDLVSNVKLELTSNNLITELAIREVSLNKKISQQAFVDMIASPLNIKSSIVKNSRRPVIFPLVVNADIPIFPLRKRIAPFFNFTDFIVNRTRLSRPFLEHIIYARNKALSGVSSPLKTFIIKNIENEVQGTSRQNDLKDLLKNSSSLELQLIQKFIKALKKSAKIYIDTKKLAKELRTKIDLVPKPKKEPTELSGEDKTLSQKDKQAFFTAEVGNENIVISTKLLDDKISRIQQELSGIDTFLQLMPTEGIKQSDEINRIGSPFITNNIVSDLFVGEFIQLASFERVALESKRDEALDEKALIIRRYEDVKMLIMHFTGEFTGLSIFDIICVLLALFTVDIKYLISLLNKDAQSRLIKNDNYYKVKSNDINTVENTITIDDIAPGASKVSVSDALVAIQEEVANNFNLVESFIESFNSPENKKDTNT